MFKTPIACSTKLFLRCYQYLRGATKGLYYKKYYGFVMYGLRSKLVYLLKLVCLSKPVKGTGLL